MEFFSGMMVRYGLFILISVSTHTEKIYLQIEEYMLRVCAYKWYICNVYKINI